MSGRNTIRIDVEGGYYHIYNRGVEKREIFQDSQDYEIYIAYIEDYLRPKNSNDIYKRLNVPGIKAWEKERLLKLLRMNNYCETIDLMAYCLMPNHFHLFLKQNAVGSIYKFINSLNTRYVMYFNKKYKRVGHLFQSRYKAVLITNEAQYLHLSRYIHKQALAVPNASEYGQPSSYPEYIGKRNTPWVHPEEILSFFSKSTPSLSYERFVSEYDSFHLEADDLEL
jgi:REP element-mobilizing transposase RayT